MSDRKQIAFDDSITKEFMKTEGKRAKNKMIHLLAVDKERKAEIRNVDRKIDYLINNIEELKKMLEGVIR